MVGKEGTKWQGPKEFTKVMTDPRNFKYKWKKRCVTDFEHLKRCESLHLNFEGLDKKKYS